MKKIFLQGSLMGAFLMACLLIANIDSNVQALSRNLDTSKFDPGFIIDDQTFTDSSTMTVEEIQAFLEETVENGECTRTREDNIGNTLGPYTCLFEFQQNPQTGENNYGLFNEDGQPTSIDGGIGAAQMIYDAAHRHSINPQVLIVLLQKEQSLITDSRPILRQFTKATGYACPDFAACDPTVSGLFNQIDRAAWQFRQYIENLDSYWYIIGDNQVLYHPNAACGSKTVNFRNKATIGLYLYTPYVPNQAALNNFYGVGDNCSSYGNRNFWTYFNHWFGSSTSNGLMVAEEEEIIEEEEDSTGTEFELVSVDLYADFTKSKSININQGIFKPNQAVYVVVEVVNTSKNIWQQSGDENVITLMAYADDIYQSQICGLVSPDIYCPDSVSMSEDAVGINQNAQFEFILTMPANSSIANQSFHIQMDNEYLTGEPISLIFLISGEGTVVSNNEAEDIVNTNSEDEAEEEESAQPTAVSNDSTNADVVVILPANWDQMSVLEKILANPWGCHDTTKIRADNGQCLSGGYTIPQSAETVTVNTNSEDEAEEEESAQPTAVSNDSTNADVVVILPANWDQMSVLEKILANPWGCHDTTKIRADNGQCLSGGYTIPQSAETVTVNTNSEDEAEEEESAQPTAVSNDSTNADVVVILPANWDQMSVLEKILANPWGCHDTTKIRADNGQCLSGGYTIPQSAETVTVNTNSEDEAEEEESAQPTAVSNDSTNADVVVILPANWDQMSVLEKILANPWGCHDTTKIRADNGQCLSGGYTIPSQQ